MCVASEASVPPTQVLGPQPRAAVDTTPERAGVSEVAREAGRAKLSFVFNVAYEQDFFGVLTPEQRQTPLDLHPLINTILVTGYFLALKLTYGIRVYALVMTFAEMIFAITPHYSQLPFCDFCHYFGN